MLSSMKPLASAFIVALLSTLVSSTQAQSKNIHEQTDPYTGLRSLFLEVGTRTCPGDQSPGLHDPEVHLLLSATQNPDRSVSYFLTPELDHAGYTLNLRKNATMDTLLGDAAGSYTTLAGSTTTTQYSGDRSYLHETIPFNVSQADLAKLSSAEWFQFRINGSRQDVQRCTDAKHLRDVAEFVHAAASFGPPVEPAQPIDPTPHALSGNLFEQASPDNGLKTLTLAGVPAAPCPGDPTPGPSDPQVLVRLTANQRTDGGVWYFVEADMAHGDPLNLRRRATLEARFADGTKTFNTINGSELVSAPNPDGHSTQHETVAFHVHQPDLIALGKTPLTQFTIQGNSHTLRRCVRSDQFPQLNEFISISSAYKTAPIVASAPTQPH
jgi:hypothetical protein